MGEPDSADARGRATAVRIAVGLTLIFLLAGATAVAIPLVQSLGAPARTASAARARPAASAPPASSPSVIAFACTVDPQDTDHCRRASDDMIRRAPLTEAERADADRVGERVLAVLPEGVRETRCGAGETAGVCRLPVSPPSRSEVRRALTAAGYGDALVRVARPDDPAPRGSVLVAVRRGTACVVIYHNGYPHRTVGGRLPDGTCLPE